MTRFTKFAAVAVMVVGGVAAMGSTASAALNPVIGTACYQPQPYPHPYPPFPNQPCPPRYDCDYIVYERCSPNHPWKYVGRYETLQQAQRVEWSLERQGRQAFIKRVCDNNRPFPFPNPQPPFPNPRPFPF